MPVPGWTAEHEWEGFVPFEELPSAVDPDRGYLVTANDRIHGDDYPHLIGHDFHAPGRAAQDHRAARRSGTITRWKPAGRSRATPCRSRLATCSPASRSGTHAHGHCSKAGITTCGASSSPAALWEVFVDELTRRAVGRQGRARGRVPDRSRAVPVPRAPGAAGGRRPVAGTPRRCPPRSLGPMRRCDGSRPTAWRWGDIHRARFAHPLGRMPGLEPLFVAAEHPLGGDEQTVNNAGFEGDGPFDVYVVPSWRAIYDLSNLDDSKGGLPTGSVGQSLLAALERPGRRLGRGGAPPAPVHPSRRRSRRDGSAHDRSGVALG